ncbi:MAG TPA: family 10 glycosylhydrolase [Thermogutta sp.]|nr:family 10 glycosylhydrolase [Thermogutta sp.]
MNRFGTCFLAVVTTFGLCGWAFAESSPAVREIVLEEIAYTDEQAAQQAWRASEGTPPIRLIKVDGGQALEIGLPFARHADLPRSIHDREVKLDLSRPGEFILELEIDRPEAVGHLSLYFRSGAGWYAGSGSVSSVGKQLVRFVKAEFRSEGKPAGWGQIDGIRISFWRGASVDAQARIYRLTALEHPVALLVPTAVEGHEQSELRTIREAAERVGRLITDLGLGFDTLDDRNPSAEVWAEKAIIIVPYAPRLSPTAASALAEAIRRGTKVILFYQAPQEVLTLLGVGKTRWMAREYESQFAEVRFDRSILPDLPVRMRQSSWNITEPIPTVASTRVIGEWFDAQGKPTGRAAMILSPHGAFFSHILLGGDAENQRVMLAAVMGALRPDLKPVILRGLLAKVTPVGHLQNLDELREWLKKHAPDTTSAPWQLLQEAESLLSQIDVKDATRPEQISLAALEDIRKKIVTAYLMAQPSPSREGRAYWNHTGLGAYPGDWERTARELAEAGFNMVLPNMLWGGVAHYASDLLPRSASFEKYGDQIAQCVEACHRHGIEVHVWKVNFNLSTAPNSFVEQMRASGRTQVTRRGEPTRWLCPSHPENQKLECETMLEVVKKYGVDGIHFDYIRYPDGDNCYCDGCRQRFEKDTGLRVTSWPDDCYSGSLRAAYRNWRCEQITRVVQMVAQEAKRLRVDIKISAAVFAEYPACRESVGQDWVSWVKAGYLDFICPMDYTEDDRRFERLVKTQAELIGGRIPMYPGIGAYRLDGPDRVVGQISIARQIGVPGFTIFDLNEQSPQTIFPAVRLGATKEKAIPAHRHQP